MEGVVGDEDLEKIEQEVILNKQNYLVEHVKPDDIYDHLIAKKLIGRSASEKFCLPTNTIKEKVRIILQDVIRSRPGYLKELCAILRESRQDHVAEELLKEFKVVSKKYGYHCSNGEVTTGVGGAAVNGREISNGEISLPRNNNHGDATREISIGEKAQLSRPVQIKDFTSLFSELQPKAAAKWRDVGRQLDLEDYELDTISAGQSNNDEANITKVFELWKQQSLKQTWNDVITAVNDTGRNPQLCEDLKEKFKADLTNEAKMKDISNDVVIPMAPHWFELGLSLEIDESQLSLITPRFNDRFFREMLQTWWSQNLAKDRTWNKVVDALDKARLQKLANKVYQSQLA